MKIVATCQTAMGHFHTLAPLARALEIAGHDVTFAVGRGFGGLVERGGFRVVEVGPGWLATGSSAPYLERPERRLRVMAAATGALVADLVEHLRCAEPDVVLHESLEWAAPLAADAAGVPYAALGQLPRLPRALLAETMAGPWNAGRSRLGLADDPLLARLYPYLYLDAYLPSMQPLTGSPLEWFSRPERDVAHPVRPSFFEVEGASGGPPWTPAGLSRPLAYVTMGSVFNRDPDLFDRVVSGVTAAGLDAVVTLGEGSDPAALGPRRPGVQVASYIPQSRVFPFADVLVSHPGYLTVMAAIDRGLPMVLVPVAVDHPYHAHRLAAAGAAVVLRRETLTAASVAAAVEEVRSDPLYAANVRRLQAELHAMPGLETAVPLVEELARTREPVWSAVA